MKEKEELELLKGDVQDYKEVRGCGVCSGDWCFCQPRGHQLCLPQIWIRHGVYCDAKGYWRERSEL